MKRFVLIVGGLIVLVIVLVLIVDGSSVMGFSRLKQVALPDLLVRNIDYNEVGLFDGLPGLEVTICNYGKAEVDSSFGIDFEANNSYGYDFDDPLAVNECSNFKVGYYALMGADSSGQDAHVVIEVDSYDEVKEIDENNNSADFAMTVPTCGNNVCEDGETQAQCPYDCETECSGSNCGEEVYVRCGCEESEGMIGKIGLIKEACDSCSQFDDLFEPYAKMQTVVYECLADYFYYEPPRVPYLIFYYPEPWMANQCVDPQGCELGGGWAAGFDWGILQTSFSRIVGPGADYPTEVEHLLSDVHEMTHYFVGHMLHGLPNWFNEALAYNSDKRLTCGVDAMFVEEGLAYEYAQSRIGSLFKHELNYEQIMNGEIDVPSGSHANGALFLVGLREEFGCEEDCIREIVSGLREYEETMCANGQCGIDPINGSKKWNIDNDVIYKVVTNVVGSEPDKLFDVLDLSY